MTAPAMGRASTPTAGEDLTMRMNKKVVKLIERERVCRVATTGDGATRASSSYNSAIRAQSVSAALRARAWHAAIAACKAYVPFAPPSAATRASPASPRRVSKA